MNQIPIPVLVCRVVGAVFVVIALWGFIAGDRVLIFHVNAAHNTVHLLSGLAALACGFAGGKAARYSRLFCLVFGGVYGLVALLGFAGVQAVADLLHLNVADNWLHLVLAVGFLASGLAGLPIPKPQPPAPTTPRTQ